MIFIMNPPFSCQGKSNSRASKIKLDHKIWKKVIEEYPNSEVIAIMSYSNDQFKNCKYTDISEEYSFPEISLKVKIFERNPNKPELEIKSKYELNGLYDWRENHYVENNLTQIMQESGLDHSRLVPENSLVIPENYCRRVNNDQKFRFFYPGEYATSYNGQEALCRYLLFRTTKPKELAEYIKNYEYLLNEYLIYGNTHVRNLFKCIPMLF